MKLAKLTNLALNIILIHKHKNNFLNLCFVDHYVNRCHELMNSI